MRELQQRIAAQRKEIQTLNKRCQELSYQIKIINDIDYYKSRMSLISKKVAYRAILKNDKYQREVEAIFNKPFKECLDLYEKKLHERNYLVHRFTSNTWKKDKPSRTNKSLTELVESEY